HRIGRNFSFIAERNRGDASVRCHYSRRWTAPAPVEPPGEVALCHAASLQGVPPESGRWTAPSGRIRSGDEVILTWRTPSWPAAHEAQQPLRLSGPFLGTDVPGCARALPIVRDRAIAPVLWRRRVFAARSPGDELQSPRRAGPLRPTRARCRPELGLRHF